MEDGSLKILKEFASLSFMPKAFAISALGNIINFIVLSRSDFRFKLHSIVTFSTPHRPCIKSTVNVYLSILAFADALFSLFLYVSSRQYLVNVNHQSFEIYWRLFGLSNWFYTAFRECPQSPRRHVSHETLCSVRYRLSHIQLDPRSICCCESSHQEQMRHRTSQECRIQ